MKNSITGKIATFLLSLVFLLIIVSFLFGDYGRSGSASPQDVASVDGLPIGPREYQMRLSQQVEFFNQMMGGKITPQQMEQMGIKQTVLGQIIQTKLLLSFGLKNGLALSTDEIKSEIKKLPYFQRDGKFDVGLYRNLISSNQYTASQFEEMIGYDMATRKIEQMIATQNISENQAQDILRFKLTGVKADAIRVERQDLINMIEVSSAEAQEFADKPENNKLLQDMYQEAHARYNKPEEVKAKHILFKTETPEEEEKAKSKADKLAGKLNSKNFAAKANELTEDPSGKGNGGDLGWFSRGRMVPEFETAAFGGKTGEVVGPVKTSFGYHWILIEGKKGEESKSFEQVKGELAKMAIQKRKSMDLDQIIAQAKTKIETLLNSANISAINTEKKKMNLVHLPATEVNLYDLSVGTHTLTPAEGERLFNAQNGEILDFSTPGAVFLVKVGAKINQDIESKLSAQLKTELQSQSQQFNRKFREDVIKELNSKAKVVTNPSLL
jgi:peptidyl-prolyl cis-trans isomerase D